MSNSCRYMDVELTNLTLERLKSLAIIKLAKKVGRLAGLPRGALISIVFVDVVKMRELNLKYRSQDEPTDVLSFLYNPTSPPLIRGGREGLFITPKFVRPVFGEIFLCPEMIRRRAAERGMGEEEYQKLLIVHAMLHLKGMEHGDEKEAGEMEKIEQNMMSKIKKVY